MDHTVKNKNKTIKYFNTAEHVPSELIERCIMNNVRIPVTADKSVEGIIAFGFAADGYECGIYPAVECSCPDDWPHIRIFMFDRDIHGTFIVQGESNDKSSTGEYALSGTVHIETYANAGTTTEIRTIIDHLLSTGFTPGAVPGIDTFLAAKYGRPKSQAPVKMRGSNTAVSVSLPDMTQFTMAGHICPRDIFMSESDAITHRRYHNITKTIHYVPIQEQDTHHTIAPPGTVGGERRHDFEPEYSGIIWDD